LVLRDPVSSGSHFLAAVCAVFVSLLFWRLTNHRRDRRPWVMVFGVTMVVLYAASATYHALRLPEEELRFFQKLDQSAIYCLIAGTYTPIMAILLTGPLRRNLLLMMWGLALAGVVSQWVFPKPPYETTVAVYLGMGWIGFLGVRGYYRAVGWGGLKWGILGGICYTAGAIFDMLSWPVLWPGVIRSHEFLHLWDMLGTWCHVLFMVRYVIPYRRPVYEVAPREIIEAQAA
jgi:hemolysin III